jgi:hypothetical protein
MADPSDVSTIATDLRFSGREDFWIIVAARSEDETEIRAGETAGGRRDQGHSKDLRREAQALKEVVAALTLENRLLKKA